MNSPQLSSSQLLDLDPIPHVRRRDHVALVFNDVQHYLASRRVDIRFRQEAVATFAARAHWRSLLDAGCGDGSITAPLLSESTYLTWMDLSASMLERAQSKAPAHLLGNTEVRNEDLLEADFGDRHFDLIVSVGVIAHVEDPATFLARLRSLLHPGGRLILEFTDAFHPVGRLGRFWGALKERLAPARYQTNKLKAANLYPLFKKSGFRLSEEFRYARLPLPGVDRWVSERVHFAFCRWFFGSASRNKHTSWGNEHICLLIAE